MYYYCTRAFFFIFLIGLSCIVFFQFLCFCFGVEDDLLQLQHLYELFCLNNFAKHKFKNGLKNKQSTAYITRVFIILDVLKSFEKWPSDLLYVHCHVFF